MSYTNQQDADYLSGLSPNHRRIWNYNCENKIFRTSTDTLPSGMQDRIDALEAKSDADKADVHSKMGTDLGLSGRPC